MGDRIRRSNHDGTTRKISEIIEPQAVVEGAGVRLKRSIGTHTLDYLDPFLLLDHFQSKNPPITKRVSLCIRIAASKR